MTLGIGPHSSLILSYPFFSYVAESETLRNISLKSNLYNLRLNAYRVSAKCDIRWQIIPHRLQCV